MRPRLLNSELPLPEDSVFGADACSSHRAADLRRSAHARVSPWGSSLPGAAEWQCCRSTTSA